VADLQTQLNAIDACTDFVTRVANKAKSLVKIGTWGNAHWRDIRADLILVLPEMARLRFLLPEPYDAFRSSGPREWCHDARLEKFTAMLQALAVKRADLVKQQQREQSAPGEQITPVSRATAYVLDRNKATGRTPTITDIADFLGVNRTCMYRGELLTVVAFQKAMRQKERPPSGNKDADGTVEAYDEEE
jgi:hypothetical protein